MRCNPFKPKEWTQHELDRPIQRGSSRIRKPSKQAVHEQDSSQYKQIITNLVKGRSRLSNTQTLLATIL